MTSNQQRSLPHSEALPNEEAHLEIELAVMIENKKEGKKIRELLELAGFLFQKRTLIVDFVEPSRSVTSRVRLEIRLDDNNMPVVRDITCYMGKKSHPVAGWLEPFVRTEQDPPIPPRQAVQMLLLAIAAQNGKPIPYYCKKRRYYTGTIDGIESSVALDKPKGLLKKFPKRCLEAEAKLPLSALSEENLAQVEATVKSLATFVFELIGEDRKIEISYRRKVKKTWKKRGMRTWKRQAQLSDLVKGKAKSGKREIRSLTAIAQAA